MPIKDPEEKRKYNQEYYRKNKEKISNGRKQYYQDNIEYFSEHNKEYYENNKDDIIKAQSGRSPQYYINNKEKILNKTKDYKKTSKGRYVRIKSSANYRNIVFELSFDVYESDFFQQNCFYCKNNSNGGIDRINSHLGYIAKNMVPCCYQCNVMKSDSLQQDFFDRCLIIVKNHVIENKQCDIDAEYW